MLKPTVEVKEFTKNGYSLKLIEKEDLFHCAECNSSYFGCHVRIMDGLTNENPGCAMCLNCYQNHKDEYGE